MSNWQSTPQCHGGPSAAASDARDEAIAQCIEVVASVLPAHDIHHCCHRERQRLVARLQSLRVTDNDSVMTHGKA